MKLLSLLLTTVLCGCMLEGVVSWDDEPPYYSDRLAAFISMFRGLYKRQIGLCGPKCVVGMPSELNIYPLDVPIFRPDVTFIANKTILVVDDELPGKIRVRQYSLNNPSQFNTDQLNSRTFYNLDPDEFTLQDCDMQFTRTGDAKFVGVWSVCSGEGDSQERRDYNTVLTCDTIDFQDAGGSGSNYHYKMVAENQLTLYYIERSGNSEVPCALY